MNGEESRKLIEVALQAGRKRRSAQTGFVHHCYESSATEPHDTIPLFENFCFSLALFRSRLTENVKEAKALLERLLPFEVEGNFPVYIHEYPACRDSCLSVHLLPLFYQIREQFQTVLGEELSSSLNRAVEKILLHGQRLIESGALSQEVRGKLQVFAKQDPFADWHPKTIAQWGHFLVTLQMAPFADQKSHLARAAAHWHTGLHSYVGPYGKSLHYKREPAPTLYDLFMGSLFGSYPQRVWEDSPLLCQAALIQPLPDIAEPSQTAKSFAYSIHEEGEGALTLRWGGPGHLHTLLLSRQKNRIDADLNEESCALTFHLPEELPTDAEDEVCFFCDNHPANQIWINDKKATLFFLEDRVEIRTEQGVIRMQFSQEGEGNFSGHILRANRPFQTGAKGADIFEAYDWKVAIRTLRRSPESKIKATLTFAQKIEK